MRSSSEFMVLMKWERNSPLPRHFAFMLVFMVMTPVAEMCGKYNFTGFKGFYEPFLAS